MITNVNTPVSGSWTNIPTVPYDVFRKIGEVADDDKLSDGLAPESGDVALPRNVLYNQFLNFHSPFVITDEDIVDNDDFADDSVSTTSHDFTSGNLRILETNFKSVPSISATHKVLCDKNGDVVVCVRSEAGIHFMVMRKSIFKATNEAAGKATTSLQDYYTTAIPGDEDFPESGETYVNMKTTDDLSYYKDRANEIKNAVQDTNFDAAYDYRLYEYLLDNDLVKGKITFSSDTVKDNITEYIKLLRESSRVSAEESINSSWQTYLLMLRYQNTVRDFDNSLLPTTCAFKFSTNKDEFKEGGKCYVNK